jgi:prolyl 4-hydroxylase
VARFSRPDVVLFANVLSEAECALLVWLAREKLARSTTVDPVTGELTVIANRTSFGAFFALKENELIERLDARFAELLNWPADHAEGLQVLRYQTGGEYKPHFDYFPAAEAGSAVHLAQGGQRIASLIIYLNEVEEGGETIFPDLGLSVVPKPGFAVYFAYCNSQQQVDPLTLHGGAPVRRGEKWIATKWLRETRRA